MNPTVVCPECEGEDVECLSYEYKLYVCYDCDEHFSNEDGHASQERSSLHRTRARRRPEEFDNE